MEYIIKNNKFLAFVILISLLNILIIKLNYENYLLILMGLSLLIALISDKVGHILHFLAVDKLTKNLEKSDIKLKKSEKKFRDFFEQSNVPMCIFNLKTLKFIEANDNLCKILGYSNEEICKMELKDLVYQSDLEGTIDAATLNIHDQKLDEYTNRYITKSGKIIKLRWSFTKGDENGMSSCVAILLNGE